ncbi:MAG: cupredoxin domain-containing protein [Paenarthrobacter sp.]
MKFINRVLVVAATAALAGMTGCSAPNGPSSSAATASAPASASAAWEASVAITNFAFEVPASVRPGAMIAVTNTDSAPHTLTATDKGAFDVDVPAGATVIFAAPDEPGEYRITCTFHPQMAGTLVVK